MGWREETNEQWKNRLIWRRNSIMKTIEAIERKDIEKSKAIVGKIDEVIKDWELFQE